VGELNTFRVFLVLQSRPEGRRRKERRRRRRKFLWRDLLNHLEKKMNLRRIWRYPPPLHTDLFVLIK